MTRYNQYGNRIVNGKMCVWLQDYGWQAAKLGKEIKVGDHLRYNYGSIGEVVAIERETEKSIFVSVNERGTVYTGIKIGKETYKPVVEA